MNKIFTWKDIESELLESSESWPVDWSGIDVYSDELVIYTNEIDHVESYKFLKQCLSSHYDDNNHVITLDIMDKSIIIIFESTYNYLSKPKGVTPLFRGAYLRKSNYVGSNSLPELSGVPVVAFHSYKGGVGRTLTLISLLREISSNHINKAHKVLVIDSDIEAPGLTWLAKEDNVASEISYLDILSILHLEDYDNNTVKNIAEIVGKSVIRIESDDIIESHYFIPAYRIESQIMNIYAQPEKIVTTKGKEFIIAEFLSKLGKELGADVVLVDLRAGLSDFSAPILFDPRVKKIFVTSTSLQSVKGIRLILEQVYKDPISNNYPYPSIMITMIPDKFDENKKIQIISDLTDCLFSDDPTDIILNDFIIEVPFSSDLIHLEGFTQISRKLSGTPTAKASKELYKMLFDQSSEIDTSTSDYNNLLNELHSLADNETTAEGENNISFNLLATEALQNLVRAYRKDIPNIVMLGAKGSGKTFIYKQLLKCNTWENFVNIVNKEETIENKTETFIYPLLASTNRSKFTNLIKQCIQNTIDHLDGIKKSTSAYAENADQLSLLKTSLESEIQWKTSLADMFLKSSTPFESFNQFDDYLESCNKRVLYIIDGLEDIFNDLVLPQSSKIAIKALCQGLINDLNELTYHNVGVIIFLRKDIAENSITTNFSQFNNQYSQFELKWSHTEALRLALWLACQVSNIFQPEVPVEKATREIIEKSLEKLWGLKLGKANSNEAFSARWILAALSDFNSQLQARDIVRFLKYATLPSSTRTYSDRLIMPSEIKNAIVPCSRDKIDEIKLEIQSIGPILEKFENIPPSDKMLPINPDDIELTQNDRSILEQQGYLKLYKDQYYMPEIIRHALGFKYQKGARPKVLSLLFN